MCVFCLLGIAVFLHIAPYKVLSSLDIFVWPPGPFYLGESVVLCCRVKYNSTTGWTYEWTRSKKHNTSTMEPRHLVSGQSYFITGLTKEDQDLYRCKTEQKESNTTLTADWNMLMSKAPVFSLLTLTPNSREFFEGESFRVKCPKAQINSSGWSLKHFIINPTDRCSLPQSAVCRNESEGCVFTAARGTSGIYWCENSEGRSSAVSITVSNGIILLKTPALPVQLGDNVNLSCQYRTNKLHGAIFLKNGEKITNLNVSRSHKVINLTIYNVSKNDEGFYMCASSDRRTESLASWLSVQAKPTTPQDESWKWITVACSILLLFLIPLIVWLARYHRYQKFSTQSCWPSSKGHTETLPVPQTKQDVTEVQWDLSWMEMSNLLDQNLHINL